MSTTHRWAERRRLRGLERRRRRGGDDRGPVALQRLARAVRDLTADLVRRSRRAVRGDRPLIVALVGVLMLAGIVVSAPLQSFLDGRDRVDHLEAKADALDGANEQLEQRALDLEDDTTIELLAREQLGLIRPGEVAYAISPPEVERPRITAPREVQLEERTWYDRLATELRERLGG